ncbi:MAG: DUF5063 domain-containing protein [Bacteroidales bacterium]|nr:DUF5063 domain-containing protein [Bacteroidales bacterium]
MTDKEDIIKSKTVIEVIAVASEYCMFIDKMDRYEMDEALSFLQKILPALYLKGSLFPNIEVEDDSANERYVTEEEYETMRCRLSVYFGDADMFSAVDLSEGEIDSAPIALSELLSDIYTDLKDFLMLYARESVAAKENAIAACHYYFHFGWGMRLLTALPYIHKLVADTLCASQEEEA